MIASRMPFRPRHGLAILLALMTGAFLLPGLGLPVMNREQELRVALTARTMLESGDWLRPEFLGEPRLRKPPVMYWAVATAYRFAGTTASATAARLPSVMAGMALVLLLYAGAVGNLGRRRTFTSALVCGTSFIFLKQARVAETDTLLLLGTTGAALSLFQALTKPGKAGWWWMAGLCAGLGFMTKGPAALVLPLLAAILYSATTPQARTAWRSWAPCGALLFFLALTLPWYLLILGESTGTNQVRDELQRAATLSEHPGPWYYYLYTLFHAQAPWSLALPAALAGAWRWRQRPLLRFALAWLASSFLVLSLMDSKQIHYALLLIPPASLLAGNLLGSAWVGRGRERKAGRLILRLLLAAGSIVGLLLLTAAWIPAANLPRLPTLLGGAVASVACLSAFLLRARPPLAGGLFLLALFSISTAASVFVLPGQAKEVVIRDAVVRNQVLLEKAPHVIFSGPRNAIAEFYAGRSLEVIADAGRAWRKAKAGEVVIWAGEGKPPPAPPFPVPAVDDQTGKRMRCAVLVKP